MKNKHCIHRRSYFISIFARRTCRIHKGRWQEQQDTQGLPTFYRPNSKKRIMLSGTFRFANTTVFNSKVNVNTHPCYQILNLNFLFETLWVEQELVAVRPGLPALHLRIGWKNRMRLQISKSIWAEKFWVLISLCLKIRILSRVTNMMLFEIEKINALQTSFA